MAIFCRRTLQRLLNENAAFLTRKQLVSHVNKLNDGDLSAEWELVLLNAFSKLGKVVHEKNFNGKKPDLLFTSSDEQVSFLSDIKTVSDEGIEIQNPQKQLSQRLHDEVARHGIRGHWRLDVGGDLEGARRTGSMVKLRLPPLSRFDQDIFNSEWEAFVLSIKSRPEEQRQFTIRTQSIDLTISYTPSAHWTGSGGYPGYKTITNRAHLIQNSVWNGLVSKAAQLEATDYGGPLGIILCDGGSDFLKQPNQIIPEFFSVHSKIDFVLVFEAIQTMGPNSSNEVLATLHVSPQMPHALEEFLLALPQVTPNIFPDPERSAINAVHAIESTRKRMGASHYGGMRMRGNEVRISSRTVLDLLAGKLKYEDFPENHRAIFGDMVSEGRLFLTARIEKDDCETDDDWFVFEFGEPDPAVRPFTVPVSR